MTWYGTVLLVLAALGAVYAFLLWPRCPRRSRRRAGGMGLCAPGLRNAQRPENSLPAFAAAVEAGYGIELDVHLTRDNVLVVFHDDTLSRMCGISKRVEDMTLPELERLRLQGSEQGIPTLDQVLAVVEGKVPLIVEIKADKRLAELCRRTRERLRDYGGAYCVESFHPLAVRWFRKHAPEVIRGQLAYGLGMKRAQGKKNGVLDVFLASLTGNALGRPDFVAHDEVSGNDLPTRLTRRMGAHLVAWTVRDPARMRALRKKYELQIFEGFLPDD